MKNYLQFKEFSQRYDHYAFVDVLKYYADDLFIQHQVRVHFGDAYEHPEEPYVIIFCKVRKGDKDKFLAALSDLNRKMLLCGYLNYEAFCESAIGLMGKRINSAAK